MPLDPGAAAHLEALRLAGAKPFDEISVEEARLAGGQPPAALAGPPPAVHEVIDTSFPGPTGPVPVRFCVPRSGGPLPVVVYFHGGGLTVGSIDSHDGVCRSLSVRADAVVMSVEYRLAPEHKHPAAVDDACAAVEWAAANAARFVPWSGLLAVAGDSSGGTLATVTARRATRRGAPDLVGQVLFYPTLDCGFATQSWRELGDGYILTRRAMQWYWSQSLNDPAEAADPDVSPIRADDLSGMAPASILTCEFDPLRDEGEIYAQRLAAAGVEVIHRCHPGLIHGALRIPGRIPAANAMLDDAAADLRRWFEARAPRAAG